MVKTLQDGTIRFEALSRGLDLGQIPYDTGVLELRKELLEGCEALKPKGDQPEGDRVDKVGLFGPLLSKTQLRPSSMFKFPKVRGIR